MNKTHIPRKRFGQHFLRDQNLLKRMEATLNIQPQEAWLEIGPGEGALTTYLLSHEIQLTAIEIDRDLSKQLQIKFQQPYFKLIEADALKFDLSSLGHPIRVVGNLPYNISTPLLFHLLKFKAQIQDMHFLLQREVVERMTARENEANYGRLSVMLQYHCQTHSLLQVPPSAFSPPPKVQSAFVRVIPYTPENHPYGPVDAAIFEQIVRASFSLRRKTIHNSLKNWLHHSDFESLSIDPNLRPENLSISMFVKMANYLYDQKKGIE